MPYKLLYIFLPELSLVLITTFPLPIILPDLYLVSMMIGRATRKAELNLKSNHEALSCGHDTVANGL